MLVLRLSGAAAAVRGRGAALGGEVIDAGAGRRLLGRAARPAATSSSSARARRVDGGATLWRLSVPPTAPPLALPGEQLVEWGGAQRWLVHHAPAAHGARRRGRGAAAMPRCSAATTSSAGVFAPLTPPLDRIHRELKRAFDPDGVFNPGRLYPGLCP